MIRRRRRNHPTGSSVAEVDHARSGGSSRGSKRGGGIVLGTLDEMIIEAGGRAKRYGKKAFRGAHLAWLPSKRNFAVVYKKGRENPAHLLPAEIRRLHQTFHDAAPKSAGTYEWPDPKKPLRQLGLIRSLTYSIPPNLRSPEKKGFNWVHAFGDHGESGHGPLIREKKYPDHLKPMAMIDRNGNLFIVRRPKNKYHVTKWIYW